MDINGTPFDDVLAGTDQDDVITARAGNDAAAGGLGDDTLRGGSGDDSMAGGDGDDSLVGGDGQDELSGDAGQDTLNGGDGDDALDGGDGNDRQNGGFGNDILAGGDGDDTLNGNQDDDSLDGGAGDDRLNGGFGQDEVSGGDGDDRIVDAEGNDVLSGGAGNDTILAGTGEDLLDGGAGNDRLDGDEGRDSIVAGEGDDLLLGGEDRDELYGGEGDDTIEGGLGSDLMDGGEGSDTADYVDSSVGIFADLASGEASNVDLVFLGEQTLPTGEQFLGTEIGGLSSIDYDPNSGTYFAISDDRSSINPARFYNLDLDLDSEGFDGVTFNSVTPLLNQDDSLFGPGELDPEGLRLNPATGTFYWSSEGDANNLVDPFVWEMNGLGQFIREFDLPEGFSPTADGSSGIRNNLAFESLSISANGRSLFAATENALFQDGPAASLTEGSPTRIIEFDIETGEAVGQFIYETGPIPNEPAPPGSFATNGLVEILAINNDQFLMIERAFSVGVGNSVQIYLADIENATDVTDLGGVAGQDYVPLEKTLLFDLEELGITLDNIEGLTFGPVLEDGSLSLVLVSDNNFNATQFTQFLAFSLDGDLAKGIQVDQLEGIENLNGSIFDDRFAGDSGDNRLFGDDGNDTLIGREGDDTLIGGNGDDSIDAGTGDDSVDGGAGNDSLTLNGAEAEFDVTRGEDGSFTVTGTEGSVTGQGIETLIFDDAEIDLTQAVLPPPNDDEPMLLVGDTNDNVMEGGIAGDSLDGSWGDDSLMGMEGDDSLSGDWGDDTLEGNDGEDDLSGGWGDDSVDGGAGDDKLEGNWGNDVLIGGEGDDFLIGSWGDDSLEGGAGTDVLQGDRGGDSFIFIGEFGNDRIVDFGQGDVIVLEGYGILFQDLAIAETTDGSLIEIEGAGSILIEDSFNLGQNDFQLI